MDISVVEHALSMHEVLDSIFNFLGFPGGSDSKESACNAGDPGLILRLERCPGKGNGNALQYSCLENPMDKGAWQSIVHKVAKSWKWLSNCDFHFFYHIFFIHSSVDGHPDCFQVLAIVNSAAVNVGTQVSFWNMIFSGLMASSGIAGS